VETGKPIAQAASELGQLAGNVRTTDTEAVTASRYCSSRLLPMLMGASGADTEPLIDNPERHVIRKVGDR
jgi:hypothetical protein